MTSIAAAPSGIVASRGPAGAGAAIGGGGVPRPAIVTSVGARAGPPQAARKTSPKTTRRTRRCYAIAFPDVPR
jgi:hypothetical protein